MAYQVGPMGAVAYVNLLGPAGRENAPGAA